MEEHPRYASNAQRIECTWIWGCNVAGRRQVLRNEPVRSAIANSIDWPARWRFQFALLGASRALVGSMVMRWVVSLIQPFRSTSVLSG